MIYFVLIHSAQFDPWSADSGVDENDSYGVVVCLVVVSVLGLDT